MHCVLIRDLMCVVYSIPHTATAFPISSKYGSHSEDFENNLRFRVPVASMPPQYSQSYLMFNRMKVDPKLVLLPDRVDQLICPTFGAIIKLQIEFVENLGQEDTSFVQREAAADAVARSGRERLEGISVVVFETLILA